MTAGGGRRAAGGGRQATESREETAAGVRGGRRHSHTGQRRTPADGATQTPPLALIGPPEKALAYQTPTGLSRTSPTFQEPESNPAFPLVQPGSALLPIKMTALPTRRIVLAWSWVPQPVPPYGAACAGRNLENLKLPRVAGPG